MDRLYGVTLFLSAALLFCVQPMIGKMVLPLLGGSPSVWNGCMLFFQAALLLGYGWAHLSARLLSPRKQTVVHLGLLLLPVVLLLLPIEIAPEAGAAIPNGESPVPWLLLTLAAVVGLPFFVLSASTPMLQRWFAASGRAGAGDPYFLYAASNAGSLLALLAYPVVLEPWLPLGDQSWLWAIGYGALAALSLACAVPVWRARPSVAPAEPVEGGEVDPPLAPLLWRRRLRWILLAFAPTSLMLGVTSYLTTDIAAIPLLWVVPLALYLLSFVLVFARRPVPIPPKLGRVLCMTSVLLLVAWITESTHPAFILIPGSLLLVLVAAIICHGELAKDRPDPRHLTEFFLLMSVGGVLGGLFNAIVAPLVFSRVLEYPLVMLLACALWPRERPEEEEVEEDDEEGGGAGEVDEASDEEEDEDVPPRRVAPLDVLGPIGVGACTLALVLGIQASGFEANRSQVMIMFCAPAILAYGFVLHRLRFSLSMLAILLAAHVSYVGPHGDAIAIERSFFGVSRVTDDPDGPFRRLVHGHTVHGRQWIAERAPLGTDATEPLVYYHRTGPAGQLFAALAERAAPGSPPAPVAVVGLGAGALASYKKPGQELVFYEIDPAVVRIASDPRFFTFLANAPGGPPPIVLGDARLRLREIPEGHLGLLVIDAFSSDAVPVHLVTREAIALYRSRLKPEGLLALHISSRFVDLEPVLATLAADAGMVCRVHDDVASPEDAFAPGKTPSRWAVLANSEEALGSLGDDPRWKRARAWPGARPFTDDFSNLLGTLKVWGEPPEREGPR